MNKGISTISIALLTLLLTGGCPNNGSLLQNNLNSQTEYNSRALIFRTNSSSFINEFNEKSSRVQRNSYINEYLLKSDIQCRNYLNSTKNIAKNSPTQQNLYINMFDTISTLFGIQYISNTAKLMLSGNQKDTEKNQEEYQKALSPEIQRGVEITRERYAKKILNREKESIKEYPINAVKRDLSIYDKQCNETYGLIEINRALKAMQQNLYQQPQDRRKTINIKAVKDSVTAVTKKVEAKEKAKTKEKKVIKEDINNTKKTINRDVNRSNI